MREARHLKPNHLDLWDAIAAPVSALWIVVSFRYGKTFSLSEASVWPDMFIVGRRDNPWAFWFTLALMGGICATSGWSVIAYLISG